MSARTAQQARQDEAAAKAIIARAFDPTLALDVLFADIWANRPNHKEQRDG